MQVVGRWRRWFGEVGGLQIPVNSIRGMKSFFPVKCKACHTEASPRHIIPRTLPSLKTHSMRLVFGTGSTPARWAQETRTRTLSNQVRLFTIEPTRHWCKVWTPDLFTTYYIRFWVLNRIINNLLNNLGLKGLCAMREITAHSLKSTNNFLIPVISDKWKKKRKEKKSARARTSFKKIALDDTKPWRYWFVSLIVYTLSHCQIFKYKSS